MVGDVPIFVAYDSSDVWSHPELFLLDDHGAPTVVAGVPPDAFSASGQRWGNPLYRWDVMARQDFAWWIERLRAQLSLSDLVRIDHFIVTRCWAVPASETIASHGRWIAPAAAMALSGASGARRSARHRRRSGTAHPGGGGPPRPLRPSWDRGPTVRFWGRCVQPLPATSLQAQLRGIHRHSRQRYHRRMVSVGAAAGALICTTYLARRGEDIAYDLIHTP